MEKRRSRPHPNPSPLVEKGRNNSYLEPGFITTISHPLRRTLQRFVLYSATNNTSIIQHFYFQFFIQHSLFIIHNSSFSIHLEQAGKRFNRDWIFRKITATFTAGKTYAITGPNGSGKSTLLQVIAAGMQANEGKIKWMQSNKQQATSLPEEEVFQHIAICAPYLEIIEEMTAAEFLQFHASFKPLLPQVSITEIISIVGLQKAADKQIRFFSSGMKQRIKLAQAIFSDVPVLLLDEPCTNLDVSGYELYHQLINNYCNHKLVIVSSNDINEYDFCAERINILDYK